MEYRDLGMILKEQSRQIARIGAEMMANNYAILPITEAPVKRYTLDEALKQAQLQKIPCVIVQVTKFTFDGTRSIKAIVNDESHKWYNLEVSTGHVNRDGLVKCTTLNKKVDYIHISKLIYL